MQAHKERDDASFHSALVVAVGLRVFPMVRDVAMQHGYLLSGLLTNIFGVDAQPWPAATNTAALRLRNVKGFCHVQNVAGDMI